MPKFSSQKLLYVALGFGLLAGAQTASASSLKDLEKSNARFLEGLSDWNLPETLRHFTTNNPAEAGSVEDYTVRILTEKTQADDLWSRLTGIEGKIRNAIQRDDIAGVEKNQKEYDQVLAQARKAFRAYLDLQDERLNAFPRDPNNFRWRLQLANEATNHYLRGYMTMGIKAYAFFDPDEADSH